MNDERGRTADARRKQTTDLFLQRTLVDIETLRRIIPSLTTGDAGAWQQLRMFAQRVAETSRSLELGVLSACTRELANLAQEQAAGARLDAHFMLSVGSAIEMIAIELDGLAGESGSPP